MNGAGEDMDIVGSNRRKDFGYCTVLSSCTAEKEENGFGWSGHGEGMMLNWKW